MQLEWKIKSRSDACEATGRPFAEGENFHTVLFREDDGFRRLDLSEDAWKARAWDPEAEPVFSSWRSKFEPPAPPPAEPLPRDDAEGMLRRLLESEDPAHTNTRYLLAVMLERKRILRPQPSPEPGTMVYEHASTGETFIITDPDLSLSDLVSVQEEVSSLLAGLSAPIQAEAPVNGDPAPETPETEEPSGPSEQESVA